LLPGCIDDFLPVLLKKLEEEQDIHILSIVVTVIHVGIKQRPELFPLTLKPSYILLQKT